MQVYYVRKATLKTADKRFNNMGNDYEMTFNAETEVIPCEDASDLPSVTFSFVPINQLEQHQPNTVIGALHHHCWSSTLEKQLSGIFESLRSSGGAGF